MAERVSPFRRLHSALDRALRPVEFLGILIAAALMFTIMVLVSLDAILRYAFSNPLTFQYQLTEEYLLVGLIFMAAAWGYRTGGYIRITGLSSMLPPLWRSVLLRAGLFASAIYVAVLAWTAGTKFAGKLASGETSVGGLEWPEYLSWVWVPAGLGILALRLLLVTFGPESNLDVENDHQIDA